ncbi:MAG TPA: DMT family transporter [Hypericibacter adhaerens]|jgi:drug/metabolite transporter (DMT)-like permease|uniref:DMT family transporter n=1 Tax=Hypericibacter adhaerens TaxID=2602016 RepID=UPI002C64E3C0|nr:DMT family transporter [Hypericibacter adhaerens]HWA46176.1 DMT family transporter [Hypericibacter adhaerens]
MASTHHSPSAATHPSGSSLAAAHAAERAQHLRGLLSCSLAAIIWSSGGVVVRSVTADAWTIIFWRSVFAFLFLFGLLVIRERGRIVGVLRDAPWASIGMGLCFCTASVCFVVALDYTTVAKLLFLQGISPFIAAIASWLILHEAVRLRTWVAMAGALVGIGIMEIEAFAQGGNPIGDLLGIVIGFAFAGATVILRSNRKVRMIPAACYATIFAGTIAYTQAPTVAISSHDLPYLFFFGFGQLGLGMALYTSGARHIPAALAGLAALLEPALGPIWVWLVFAENPGLYAVIGGVMLIGSLILHGLYDMHAGRRLAPPAV